MIRIVFPELNNPVITEAVGRISEIEPVSATNLDDACRILSEQRADAIVAGLEYTSRDVILAMKNQVGMSDETFSGAFMMMRGDEKYILADTAACKHPTAEQLYDIVYQTYKTAKTLLDEDPRIAMLSFSTLGSGGHDESLDKIHAVVERIQKEHPEILIDGEMQLDAAVNIEIGNKKAPNSPVAGQANVLIAPDLNSGNILYKAMEQFGGFTAAGPILQGFSVPASDLSRGSTVEDIVAVIEAIKKITKDNLANNKRSNNE